MPSEQTVKGEKAGCCSGPQLPLRGAQRDTSVCVHAAPAAAVTLKAPRSLRDSANEAAASRSLLRRQQVGLVRRDAPTPPRRSRPPTCLLATTATVEITARARPLTLRRSEKPVFLKAFDLMSPGWPRLPVTPLSSSFPLNRIRKAN